MQDPSCGMSWSAVEEADAQPLPGGLGLTSSWLGPLDEGAIGGEEEGLEVDSMMFGQPSTKMEETFTPPDNAVQLGASTVTSGDGECGAPGDGIGDVVVGGDRPWSTELPPWVQQTEPEPAYTDAPPLELSAPLEASGAVAVSPKLSSPRPSPRGKISKRAKPMSLRAIAKAKAKREAGPSYMVSSTPFGVAPPYSSLDAAAAVGADRWSMTQSEDWGHQHHFQGGVFDDVGTGLLFGDALATPDFNSSASAMDGHELGGGALAVDGSRKGGGGERSSDDGIEDGMMIEPPLAAGAGARRLPRSSSEGGARSHLPHPVIREAAPGDESAGSGAGGPAAPAEPAAAGEGEAEEGGPLTLDSVIKMAAQRTL